MREKFYVTKVEELKQVLDRFGNTFSLDTETTGLRYDTLELEGISMADSKTAYYFNFLKTDDKEKAITLYKNFFKLKGKDKYLFLQNAVFDMKVLHKYGILLSNSKVFDPMVADHLLDETIEHGLKAMAQRYLGVQNPMTYEQARRYGSGSKEFIEYATNDAIWTYDIAQKQVPLLEQEGLTQLMRMVEIPYTHVLAEMQIEGVLIDKKELARQRVNVKNYLTNITTQLLQMIDEPYKLQATLFGDLEVVSSFNLNSSQQIADVLFNRLNLPIIEYTEGGTPSAGSYTLKILSEKHEFPKLLLKHREVSKLKSAFLDPMDKFIQSDGKARPNFNVARAKTGRLSSSEFNAQQLPNEDKGKDADIGIRKMFIAPAGYKMIAADYSGQENKVLAQISQDPEFIKMLRGGYDLHLINANTFFGLNIPEEYLSETHPKYKEIREQYGDYRSKAKAITFGIAYGKTAKGFADDFGITEEEAQRRLDMFFNKFKGIRDAMDKAHKDVDARGFVRAISGRKRRFKPKVGNNGEHYYSNASKRQSFNFLIQGMSADMIKIASIKTHNLSRRNPEWGLKQIMTVHDENVYIVKQEYVEEAGEAIKKCFESAVNFVVSMDVDIGVGNSYAEAK